MFAAGMWALSGSFSSRAPLGQSRSGRDRYHRLTVAAQLGVACCAADVPFTDLGDGQFDFILACLSDEDITIL